MIAERTEGEVIAIDGKTLRRSHDKQCDKAAINMVNAWGSSTGMVLGQLKTSQKSNEITAIPALLNILEISGCIISIDIDAMWMSERDSEENSFWRSRLFTGGKG